MFYLLKWSDLMKALDCHMEHRAVILVKIARLYRSSQPIIEILENVQDIAAHPAVGRVLFSLKALFDKKSLIALIKAR